MRRTAGAIGLGRRSAPEEPRRLAGVLTSYTEAYPKDPELRGHLDDLARYLTASGLPFGDRKQLEQRVVEHAERVRRETARRELEARLFVGGDRPARPVRRRHGSPFCPGCHWYKDYRKECPHCRHIEFTL